MSTSWTSTTGRSSAEQWPSTEEGGAIQAEQVEAHYRRLFAHPSVEALTYWGVPDRGMWLNAPGGLLRRDGTPKPAYHRLRELIRGQWWTQETTLRTDQAGRVSFTGSLGDYQLSLGRTSGGSTEGTTEPTTTPATAFTLEAPGVSTHRLSL